MPVLDKKLIEPVGSFRTETWEGLYWW
jgi:hypothetical protein